jgi:2,3-bisphosphoglycerate-dependent phosphoglycerate mutase
LSEAGIAEARTAASMLADLGVTFDLAFTSRLARARRTLDIAAEMLRLPPDSVRVDWRLNERHYGALQGEARDVAVERYGNRKVAEWRRSYDAAPPELTDEDPRWREQLERFPEIPGELQPRSESLAAGAARAAAVWTQEIAPALRRGSSILVAAHTSPIRGIERAIYGWSDRQSADFRIATGLPIVHLFDADLRLVDSRDLVGGLADRIRRWTVRNKPDWLAGV